MKIAILGGSFNPIHIGHLALADEVCSSLGYDKVLFVPTYKAPHKDAQDIVSAEERLEMVRLACECDSRFEAEPCEIEREGVSYTWDTVCFLEEKYNGQLHDKIGLIMGDDLLPGFHLWKNAQALSKKCNLILANRPYTQESASHANKPRGEYAKADFSANLDYDSGSDPLFFAASRLKNAVLPLSSTDIRARVAGGHGFRYLVPPTVFRYIIDKGLYTHGNN